VSESILTSVKKILGIDDGYVVFDVDVTLHINSVFSTLQQLGIGPAEGFAIEDDTATWDDFLDGSLPFNAVKTYVCLRVKLLFDPPTTSYFIEAIEKQVKELEWRLNSVREETEWTEPVEV